MILTRTIRCRFYGALNRFLAPEHRNRSFFYAVRGVPAIKDTLEALGVPHTEIDCVVVNGRCVRWYYQIRGGERIRVYPDASTVKLDRIVRLKPPPPAYPKFILDVHLGKLARHLRLLGFDTLYTKTMEDANLVAVAYRTKRVVLTRDIALLKHRRIRYGYFVRTIDPKQQIKEIVRRFELAGKIQPFKLCLVCNGKIRRIAKEKIAGRLPPLTRRYYKKFYHCPRCDKIYWQGAHHKQLARLIVAVKR